MKKLVLIIVAALVLFSCQQNTPLKVCGDDFSLSFNEVGEIETIIYADGSSQNLVASTVLDACEVIAVSQEKSKDALVFTKTLKSQDGQECILEESFAKAEHSVKWTIKVISQDDNWTTPIVTNFNYGASARTKIWMPWADPRGDVNSGGSDNALIANAIISGGDLSDFNSWADPLVNIPLADAKWHYGAPRYTYDNPGILYCPFQGDVLTIPMVTLMEEDEDFGLTLALSPRDLMLDLDLQTTKDGGIKFSRYNHRLGQGKAVSFSMDITVHEADWRSALAWMSDAYPEYFKPVNDLAHKIAGTGAYSNSDVDFDAEKMHKMAFGVNWRASFDFPYMGMFIPPVDDNEVWPSFVRERNIGKVKRKPTSIPKMQAYCKKMDDHGFHVLSYFNVTEFGSRIDYPRQPSKQKAGEPEWKYPNEYLYNNLADAMLYVPDAQKAVTDKGIYSAYPGRPFFTWERAVAMDPAVPSYHNFLIDQAQKTVSKLPNSYGICIDRMDWTRFYNHKTDDGVSWMGGQAVGSQNVSWHKIMDAIHPIFHDNNRVIFVNNHVKRIDQLRYVDGLFDEFTYAGSPVNTIALMGIMKPTLGWMSGDDQLLPDPDVMIQKYLYMGIFPMAPFPGNDHSMRPSKLADEVYLDYGPLFKLMKGKEWVLKPHVIAVDDPAAKVNLFKAFHGYTIPVVYAEADVVEVSINDAAICKDVSKVLAYYPGQEQPELIKLIKSEDKMVLQVPVKRNCAMLKLEVK